MNRYAAVGPQGDFMYEAFFSSPPEGIRLHPTGLPVIVPLVIAPKPDFDRKRFRLGPIEYTFKGGIVTARQEVEPIPAEELAERLASKAERVTDEQVLIRALLDRIRSLEGKGALTDDQFRAWVADTLRRTQ